MSQQNKTRMYWHSVKHSPPPHRTLALFYNMGRYGVGFFENGEFRQGYDKADWEPSMWCELNGPNIWDKNFEEVEENNVQSPK